MRSNFKDSSGKRYYVLSYRIRLKNSGVLYVDDLGVPLKGKDGSLLIHCKENTTPDYIIDSGVVLGYGAAAREKDIKGIKDIARKYDRSDEAKHTRLKSIKREMG
jgi:hypothetical protein